MLSFQDKRAEVLKENGQLTLHQLIVGCQEAYAMAGDNYDGKPPKVIFDFCSAFPTEIDSWRGIYAEVALSFTMDWRGGTEPMLVTDFIDMLIQTVGRTFTGYKGGEFMMTENTPVWVDNYGECTNTAVIGVSTMSCYIIIETGIRKSW